MKNIIIPILMLICLVSISSALALPMCQDNIPILQNCTFVTPSISCTGYTYEIYNMSGTQILNGSMDLFAGSTYQFNFTNVNETGDYKIILCDATTREIHVVQGEDGNMILAALIIIPMLLAIVFAWLNMSLDNEEHAILKIFFLLFALLCFFVSLSIGGIALTIFYANPVLQEFVTTIIWAFGGIYVLVMAYFIFYAIWKMTSRLVDEKEKRLNY